MSTPRYVELIERKRDGCAHSAEEIAQIVDGFTRGEMPRYQMSAWLMAVLLRGMTRQETTWLTGAMVATGEVADLSAIGGLTVDKHSTGGVGDTTTLVLAPLVAACGVPVAKLSGRGLGHTGGTLDKLEAIPGFRTALDAEEFVRQVTRVGVAVAAQSPSMVPADKVMYALRDVTATVPSMPLIAASVMSKKIAGGTDAILLDVKAGSGAFMKSLDEARALAEELVAVGEAFGRRVRYVLSGMEQPLGGAVGNALEVAEAIEVLRGEKYGRLGELCVVLAAEMLVLGGVAEDTAAAKSMASEALGSGRALARFEEWVAAQGGDPRIAEDSSLLPVASRTRVVGSPSSGIVQSFDTQQIGHAAMLLGAGRQRVEDRIDPGAGVLLATAVGQRVMRGAPVATLYAETEDLLDAGEECLVAALRIGEDAVAEPALILGSGGSSA